MPRCDNCGQAATFALDVFADGQLVDTLDCCSLECCLSLAEYADLDTLDVTSDVLTMAEYVTLFGLGSVN